MAVTTLLDEPDDGAHARAYRAALERLDAAGVPYLVGGAFALAHYTGIERRTKDIDLFVAREDFERVGAALAPHGWRTELTYPHWLGKAWRGDLFVDLVFSSANGIATVDAEWFEHATRGRALGAVVNLCPVEETIWSKAFIMERERYDGADIAHLVHARGRTLDWRRLRRRFGAHWRVLYAHLVLYGYVYPAERDVVPAWLLEELSQRLRDELRSAAPAERVCGGTLISREQYLVDVERWGFEDARLPPRGSVPPEHLAIWTDALRAERGADG